MARQYFVGLLCIFSRNKHPYIVRPRLHEQIKPPLIAQILDPYEVTPDEFAQIKYVLFARENAA